MTKRSNISIRDYDKHTAVKRSKGEWVKDLLMKSAYKSSYKSVNNKR